MHDQTRPLRIGFGNIERLLFEDAAAWIPIPEMRKFRDKWAISRIDPSLRPTGTAAMIDFMEASSQQQEGALSDYFGRPVTIDRADRRSVVNVEFDIGNPPDLEEMSAFSGMGTFRKGDRVYITFWR